MKRPRGGTEPPPTFAVEIGAGWERWAKRRTDEELAEIAIRLRQLQESFGHPHRHTGLGLRRLSAQLFELRIARGVRVIFALIKPHTFRLAMTGTHDEVRAWLKENL